MRAIDMKENQDFIMKVLQHSPTDFDEALKMIDTLNQYIAKCNNYDQLMFNIDKDIQYQSSLIVFATETIKILNSFKDSEEAKLIAQLSSKDIITDEDLQTLQSEIDKNNTYGIKLWFPNGKWLFKDTFYIRGYSEKNIWFNFHDFDINERIKSQASDICETKEIINILQTQKTEIEKDGIHTPYFWDAEYHEIYLSNQGV